MLSCNGDLIRLVSLLGIMMDIIFILVPIILVVMVTIDLFRMIFKSELTIDFKLIGKRFLYSVLIFFVPSIVSFVISLTGFENKNLCYKCFMEPNDRKCTEEYRKNVKNDCGYEVNANACCSKYNSNGYEYFYNELSGDCDRK